MKAPRKKILFIASHRMNRAPGQRFRFEQYYSFLEENGFSCVHSSIIRKRADKYIYSKGNYFRKLLILLNALLIRFRDVLRASDYDIVFVYREAFFIGSVFFEKLMKNSKTKMVIDYDDSVWLAETSDANKPLAWLKSPGKIITLITMSDMSIAGNRYLADFASNFNDNVKIIPTTIDVEEYKRDKTVFKDEGKICIGWTGSITTIKHFEYAVPFLKRIKEKYGDKIFIKVIGDGDYYNEVLDVKGLPWEKETEIADLSSIDIGIMPLPDNPWTRGKCALKGLQYMAIEIPAVMSPVGVNSEIIRDGVNGFLAGKTEEWVDKISLLIESKELREKIGKEARKTVVEGFSTESQKDKYLKFFNELLSKA